MEKIVDLKALIESRSKEFAEVLYKDYRPDLDKNITILDLSYESLKVNVYKGNKLSERQRDTYDIVYNTVYNVVKEKMPSNRTFRSLEDPGVSKHLTSRGGNWYIFLVDGGKNHFFLVGKSFDSTREFISSNVSSDPRLSKTRFGTTKIFKEVLNASNKATGDYKVTKRSKVDIGHIPSEDNPNLVSPLEKKIQAVLDIATTSGNTRIESAAKLALQNLYNVQASLAYSFKNTTPENISTARSVLGTGYVVCTLHTQNKNAIFSREELQVFNKLVHEVALSLPHTSGSNTIVQDIILHLDKSFTGNKTKLPQHKEQKGSKKIDLSAKVLTSSKSLQTNIRLRSKEGRFLSLANLQFLLNAGLAQRIKQNMGTGNAKNVLNYRTGRFANSAKVERITQSRDGMLSAFYSYMKYPYQTFEPGFRQGNPSSRDPKLLISKSIREIASAAVQNRMRAVRI